MITVGLLVRLEAAEGKEEELAEFLSSALPIVETEPDTVAWFGVRLSTTSFAIFDVFPDEDGRRAHLAGALARALSEKAEDLLAVPPAVEHAQVLAAKLP